MGHVGSPFRHPGRAPGYQGLLYQASGTSPFPTAACSAEFFDSAGCRVLCPPRQGSPPLGWPVPGAPSTAGAETGGAADLSCAFMVPLGPRSPRVSDLTDQGVVQRALIRPSRLRRPVPQTSRTEAKLPLRAGPKPLIANGATADKSS